MPIPQKVEVTQHILGLEPYVLIKFRNDDGELVLNIETGGGCDDPRMALLLVLSEMESLTAEEVEMLTAPRGGDGA